MESEEPNAAVRALEAMEIEASVKQTTAFKERSILSRRHRLLKLAQRYVEAGMAPSCATGALGKLMAEFGLHAGSETSSIDFDTKTILGVWRPTAKAHAAARVLPPSSAVWDDFFDLVCDTAGWSTAPHFAVLREDGWTELVPQLPPHTRMIDAAKALQVARGGARLEVVDLSWGRISLPPVAVASAVVARPSRPWHRRLLARLFGPPPVTFGPQREN